MKKEFVIIICFSLAGVLCSCFFGNDYFATYGFLNEYHMKSFAGATPDWLLLLGNIIWERTKFFVLMGILSATPVKRMIPLLLRSGFSFTGGVFLAACVMNMGIRGVLFFIVSCLPHGILYLLALLVMFRIDARQLRYGRNPILKRMIYYMEIAVLVLSGCILEAIVGTRLLQWTISLLFGY
jgi:hypothetical protein